MAARRLDPAQKGRIKSTSLFFVTVYSARSRRAFKLYPACYVNIRSGTTRLTNRNYAYFYSACTSSSSYCKSLFFSLRKFSFFLILKKIFQKMMIYFKQSQKAFHSRAKKIYRKLKQVFMMIHNS